MAEIIQSPTPVMVSSPKHKKIGIIWLVGPISLLIVTLVVYSVVSFVLKSTNVVPGSSQELISNITQIVLGFLGIIAVLLIIIGIPMGIINLNKKIPAADTTFDPRSGKGSQSEMPAEIKGWNWGAAGLTWIWGVTHSVWIALLVFIPFVNIVMIILLGMKGNEWAWRAERWVSVDYFKKEQEKWKVWGIIFFILGLASYVSSFSNYSGN